MKFKVTLDVEVNQNSQRLTYIESHGMSEEEGAEDLIKAIFNHYRYKSMTSDVNVLNLQAERIKQ